jgi:hypothetical protein
MEKIIKRRLKWIAYLFLVCTIINFMFGSFMAPALTQSSVAQLQDNVITYTLSSMIASGRLLQVYNSITILFIVILLFKIGMSVIKQNKENEKEKKHYEKNN